MESLHDILPETVDLSVPILLKDVPTKELLAILQQAADKRFPGGGSSSPSQSSQYRQHQRAIRMFGEFLGERPAVNLDEQLIEGFVSHLVERDGGTRRKYWAEFGGDIRCLVNALPDKRRPLLTPTQADAAGRLSRLTPESQEAIRRFLRDGRKVRDGSPQPFAALEPLMAATKENAVNAVLTVLGKLGLTDLRGLTDDKLEEFLAGYAARGKEDTAKSYLADISCLYRNLAATGLVAGVSEYLKARKPKRVNRDYVGADGIALLQDLRTVDMDDFLDVRNRMIVLTWLYDFGLRAGEAIRMDISDVRVEKYVVLDLRGGIQKGHGKDDKTLYSYLPESVKLVRRYLAMRQERQTSTESFLVTADGQRLMEFGCIKAVKEQCRKLGVKTFKGRIPSCHKFRHAFGTLNIESGLGLSLYEIMDRLRHEDVQTTRRVYIDNNPVIQRERHEARMKRNGHASEPNEATPVASPVDLCFPEEEATALLDDHDLGVKVPALRLAAVREGWGKRDGKAFIYSEPVVRDLAANWITKQEAASKLQMTQPQYFHWTLRNRIKTRVIGKASLVQRTDVRAAQKELGLGN